MFRRYLLTVLAACFLLAPLTAAADEAPADAAKTPADEAPADAAKTPADEAPADAAKAAAADDSAEKRGSIPSFSLDNLKGEQVSISDFKGKVVVISFWATWCAPCMQELPHLNGFQEKYKDDGLVVLAIATDGPETLTGVRRIARRKKWSMPVLLDQEGTATSLLNPRGTNPFTIFVDREGRIVHTHEGYSPGDEAKYEPMIQRLLKEDVK